MRSTPCAARASALEPGVDRGGERIDLDDGVLRLDGGVEPLAFVGRDDALRGGALGERGVRLGGKSAAADGVADLLLDLARDDDQAEGGFEAAEAVLARIGDKDVGGQAPAYLVVVEQSVGDGGAELIARRSLACAKREDQRAGDRGGEAV